MKTKRIIAIVSAIAMGLNVNCLTAFAEIKEHSTPYVQKGSSDVENAKSKPTIEVTKKVFDTTSDAAGQVVTVTIKLNGDNVDGKYSTACFHVCWDDRLTVQPDRAGHFAKLCAGDDGALSEIGGEAIPDGSNGAFLIASGTSFAMPKA